MNFADPALAALLVAWTRSAEERDRAEAHNIKFEERLDLGRLTEFEVSLPKPCSNHQQLRRDLSDFIGTYIEVAHPHVPPTFSAVNQAASLGPLSAEQKLVRLENLTRHLANSALTQAELAISLTSTRPATVATADGFIDRWNRARDCRPSFAAFKDQLVSEVSDVDWPHRLRDRLGLSHYDGRGGPLTVALMEYTVGEVVAEATSSPTISHAFSYPTFLDAKPNPQFFPTPAQLPAGAPMALFPIWSDDEIIAEILHTRLTYHRRHFAKIGTINANTPLAAFKPLRDNHHVALQLAAVRDDFGEEL